MTRGFLTGLFAGLALAGLTGFALQWGCRPPPADPRVPQLEAALARATRDLAAARADADRWRRVAVPGVREAVDDGRPEERIPAQQLPAGP